MDDRIKVGITIGDYNGIGPEVILKALSDERMFKMSDYVIYGSKQVLSFYARQLKIQNFQVNETNNLEKLNNKIPNVFPCWNESLQVRPGEATSDSGLKSFIALETAVEHLKSKKIDVLVTAPVNKHTIAIHKADFKGQTEYIADSLGAKESLMLLCSDSLKIGLATNHLPLKDVPGAIDVQKILTKIEILHESLQRDFLKFKPRIAVLGLNPHAGDNNLLGKEEKEIIAVAVNRAKEKGVLAFGPYAADGFFGLHHYLHFDAVLAMYHDQGLIPFKTISFDNGVNFTAGLPSVRTSPDHGTAYDIAGKDKADAGPLRHAIFTAIQILQNRAEFAEMTANPVEKVVIERE
ncbi:MAG: 4-hydroxythreonine-4-phosphate dehydrogenase PdxA [Chitinophagales bacterium]|nr:4-hydroxythreonine-4-phosphate dehydrogenase PdxA [Chitinophagales bacterium]